MSMTTSIKPLTQRPAWKALTAHHRKIQKLHLRKLFSDDPNRGERLTVEAAGVFYPFFGWLLSPIIAGAAMSLSSVSVISNALRLRKVRL